LEHIHILSQGVAHWNDTRGNLSGVPDLSGLSDHDLLRTAVWDSQQKRANLPGIDLRRANLQGANLARANLYNADLTEADLRGAHLESADLTGAKLIDAKLAGAFLCSAQLNWADLTNADLFNANLERAIATWANLTNANLSEAALHGMNFCDANVTNARVSSVRYSRRVMAGHYNGTIGVDSLLGNPRFLRDAADQVYIDAVRNAWSLSRPAIRRLMHEGNPFWIVGALRVCKLIVTHFLFWLWGLLDHGRSIAMVALLATSLVVAFAGLFHSKQEWFHWPDRQGETEQFAPLIEVAGSLAGAPRASWRLTKGSPGGAQKQDFVAALYYSIVTFTTLGFGDIYPITTEGRIAIIVEVLLGYITLGLLLAVLANTVARRS
jgi:uncharacterized protein YjbI with pentapeptide repeats